MFVGGGSLKERRRRSPLKLCTNHGAKLQAEAMRVQSYTEKMSHINIPNR